MRKSSLIEIGYASINRMLHDEMIEIGPKPMRVADFVSGACGDEQFGAMVEAWLERPIRPMPGKRKATLEGPTGRLG